MDQKSQEYFDQILKKDPRELDESEISFLKARRSYLKQSQLEEYESVLKNQTSQKETVKKQNANTK